MTGCALKFYSLELLSGRDKKIDVRKGRNYLTGIWLFLYSDGNWLNCFLKLREK